MKLNIIKRIISFFKKKRELKIWHISDTHGYHKLLSIPKDIDIVIFSGDESNYFDKFKNEPEFKDFINWYGNLKIKYKIFIASNHSSFVFHNTEEVKKLCEHYNIIYLENSGITIEGLKIWGSPITPSFGQWYFMKSRNVLDDFWKNIPDDTDILIVHGPPKGVLDLSIDRVGRFEFCGCKSLLNHIMNRIRPRLVLFGHIHNCEDIINAGVLTRDGIIFSNGSVVTDGKFGKLSSHGNIFTL